MFRTTNWDHMVLNTMLVIVAIFMFIFLAVLLYEVGNNFFISSQAGPATVVSKRIEKAHTTTSNQIVLVGKSTLLIPQTTYHPTQYWVSVRHGESTDETSVAESLYHTIETGQTVAIAYHYGRFDGKFSVDEIFSITTTEPNSKVE